MPEPDATIEQLGEAPLKPAPAPVEGQTNLYPELIAVPPSTAPKGSPQTNPAAAYYAIAVDDRELIAAETTVTFPFAKPFKTFYASGDTVYVQKIDGTGRWALQLGSVKNPLILLREGMVLRRQFSQLTVTLLDGQTDFNQSYRLTASEAQVTRIELLVCFGDFVLTAPEPRLGWGPRMIGRTNCVASTVRRFFCDDFNPLSGTFQGFEALAPGKGSAILLLRNADLANTLWIGSASFGQPPPSTLGMNTLFRLLPGETLTLPLAGQIVNYLDGTGLTVFTTAGTCLYDFWLSRVVTDPPVLNSFGTPY